MPAFVGREDSLTAVTAELSQPALVLIEGEAGIGKTRLLHEALATAPERTVLLAACPPLREPFPLGPVVDGVRRLAASGRLPVGDVGLSPLGGALRPLFPEWADQLPPSLEALDDSKETRHRLLSALTELLERIGVEVLVVEDAHWADAATVEWLLTLCSGGRRAGGPQLSIVVTYRPDEVPDGSLLRRLTSRTPPGMGRTRIELLPLGVADIRSLVASMLGIDEVSESFARFLLDRTDGIPLAVEEIVRLLRQRRDLVHRADGSWTRRVLDELEVPATVRDSVLERVERLAPTARRVLEAAAVVAAPAGQDLLMKVAELDEEAGRAGVAAALACGLLREAAPGRLVFRHVLDAQAVGEAIPVSERRRLHATAGAALRATEHPPVMRLNRHFREAGDTENWSRYAEASANLAVESGDDRTAVSVLLDVLTSVAHPPDRRVRLARRLAVATVRGMAPLDELAPQVVAALRGVLASADVPSGERGEIRVMLGRLHAQLGEYDAAYAEVEAALPDLAGQPEAAARPMLYLAFPRTRDWPVTRHLEWVERASTLFPRVESPNERLSFVVDHATALLWLGEDAGWRAAERLPRSAARPDDQRQVGRGLLNIGDMGILWGRYDDARRNLTEAIDLGRALGLRRLVSIAVGTIAVLDWYTGGWEGLSQTVDQLVEAEDTQPVSRLEARRIQALLDLAAGDRALAERRLLELSAEARRRGLIDGSVLYSAALARLRLADGVAAEVLRLTEPEMAMITRKGVWLWATEIAPVHLDALVGVGEVDRAEALLARFAAGLEGLDAPAPQAALVVCRAIVAEATADMSVAADLFAEAAGAWAALPRPFDELLARERQGRALVAAGSRDDGLAVLSDAQRRLTELGARWDADRVAHRLREYGVEVARVWRRGRRGYGDRLSPREQQVVALVARGLTNRQAAEALFVSPRTVAAQLSSAMRKLGVSSRTAVAMAATEAGMLNGDAGDPDPVR